MIFILFFLPIFAFIIGIFTGRKIYLICDLVSQTIIGLISISVIAPPLKQIDNSIFITVAFLWFVGTFNQVFSMVSNLIWTFKKNDKIKNLRLKYLFWIILGFALSILFKFGSWANTVQLSLTILIPYLIYFVLTIYDTINLLQKNSKLKFDESKILLK